MSYKFVSALFAGALVALSSAPAAAGEGHHHEKAGKHHFWKRLDSNDDGQISRDEFLQHAEKKFSKMDANGDGVVDKEEMKSMHKKHKKRHKHKDKDKMKNSE